MPSFRAPLGAYDVPSVSLRPLRIAGRSPLWLLFACLPLMAGIAQAQSLDAMTNDTFAPAPLAMAGMGLVTSGDFTFTIYPGEIGAKATISGSSLLTITPLDGFSAPVGFTCSGLPAGAACSFSPATVTPNGTPVTDTITVSYSNPVASLRHAPLPAMPAGLVLCAVLLFGFGKRRSALTTILAAALTLCTGCSAADQSLKTYPVILTAASGSLQHSVTFLLTVK